MKPSVAITEPDRGPGVHILTGPIAVGLGQLSHLLQGVAGLRAATHRPQRLPQHQLSLGHPHCFAGIILR